MEKMICQGQDSNLRLQIPLQKTYLQANQHMIESFPTIIALMDDNATLDYIFRFKVWRLRPLGHPDLRI